MPTLFNETDRARILERIRSLGADSRRQWGTMELPKALSHMGDQLLVALGDIQTRPVRGPMAFPPIRWTAIYWMPWPKGVQTAKELLQTNIEDLEPARSRLVEIIERFAERGADGSFAAHPLFGKISAKDWGALGAKHLDHHLRQFGA